MLPGRRALRRRFVVDPERSFTGGGTTVAASSNAVAESVRLLR
jgi:hypothetical protein